jgi:hypothetical protein
MMQRSRSGYGRSRTTPRGGRRVAPAAQETRLAAARRAAEAFVAAHWPQLAGAPVGVSVGRPAAIDPTLLARLGLERGEIAQRSVTHYTFTFLGAQRTVDGAEAPMAAAVTVDEHQQVVKASVTR